MQLTLLVVATVFAIFILLFLVSLAVNAYLFFLLNQAKKKRGQSQELRDFFTDLNTGGALVAVHRIDPDMQLLRSPKTQK